jgi:Zn finger protein HypA/HybF involved in hydrogenase expression
MPFSKPCKRCGQYIQNRTKFQKICDNCKNKSQKGRHANINLFYINKKKTDKKNEKKLKRTKTN